MDKSNKRLKRNRIIGIITFILSVLLLTTFILLVSKDMTQTNNLYEVEVLSFVFGSLGLMTSISLFFSKA